MSESTIHQQRHGYRNGHQLLESTVRLDRRDQDTIDRLSDLSGQIRPGEVVPPYLTIYPLPSRSYHVVARTWPDLNASRAGCVMTKSLLVPRERWAESAGLHDLLANLSVPDIQELYSFREETGEDAVPPISDPRTAELVEALFLEARKPIVVFEAKNPDALAIRLVTAFWPTFRSEFSLCTYALGPRKIAGRDFDIVFAPKNSRSKFSDWSGRKIEAGSPKSARHRWSPGIADAIFRSPRPTLASGDALGLLGADGPGDEAAFRKSLLWNELAEKAPTSASAVLGMLDIMNSQANLAPNTISSSLPTINAAVNSAVNIMSSADAWNFLQTLIGKTRGRDGLEPIAAEATGDAERLAALDPNAAIDFSRRFDDSSITFPVDLMGGVADGLGAVEAPINYERIPPRVGAFFVATSESFGEVLARRIRNGEISPLVIMPYFQAGESDWWDGASRRLISEMDSREFAPFLPMVLSRRSGDDLVDQINEIVRRSDLQFPEFDQGLVDAIRDDETMRVVQEYVVRNVQEARADRFLAKTIRLIPSDLEWLSDGPIEGSRSAALLAGVLAKQGDRFLIEVQRDPGMRRTMLNILAKDIEACAVEIARVLTLGAASLDDLLGFGQTVVTALPSGRLRSDLIGSVLERGLSLAEPTDERVDEIVSDYFEEVGARQLVRWSVSDGMPTARLAANLSILSSLPLDKLEKVVSCAEDLTYRLSRRGLNGLSEDVCRSWARLILDTRERSASHYLAAATTSLSATIGLTRAPVAEVVAAAFPAVYLSLVSKDGHDDFGIMGLVFALPRLLYDWDRAKPARHGLVDAFLNSNWPPAYLLLAAARAGIVDRICLRVTRQRGGKKYLNRAISDLERLASEEIAIIQKDLAEFDDVKMKNEWD